MAEIPVKIKIEPVWLREDTDLNLCKACKEKIFSSMLRLWIMTDVDGVRLPVNKTHVVLCESCFLVLQKNK